MKKIYDVRCPEGHKTEVFAELDADVRCKCGKPTKRLIGATATILDPISGDFPGATMKWAKHHEKMAKIDTSGQ